MSIVVKGDKLFHLSTKNTSYVFDVDYSGDLEHDTQHRAYVGNQGTLRHLYFGQKIDNTDDFVFTENFVSWTPAVHSHVDQIMEEFSSFGTLRYKETAMKVVFSDGTKDFRYNYKGHKVNGNCLTVTLEDVHYPLTVELHYEVFEEFDVIKRFVKVYNTGKEEILVERLYSAELGIADEDMQIINFNGAWSSEFQQVSESLKGGKKVFESLGGTVGHVANPSFIVHKNATEDTGEVYYGALAYTGNFKVTAEIPSKVTTYKYTNVLIGMNDNDFCHVLRGGTDFESPAVYLGYTNKGFTDMSHKMHDFCKNEIMPKNFANKPAKVLYNSWYATLFDVQCEEQKKLAKKAADAGVELFVVDDGWFGTRIGEKQGLGDWYVDKNKFPNGLSELVDYVNGLGMEFGIWIEPEMVNENSELYRNHPDWIYRFPNREPLTGRLQYTLNLTKEEVVQYMIESLDNLLSENNVTFIKWDMNRLISETGTCAPGAAACDGNYHEQKEIWYKHIQNFYRVISTIREKHPNVEFECCAGGGARIDYGAMRYFDKFWTSDNTDPIDRMEIQDGYSLLYPIKYMSAWITDDFLAGETRRPPITFRMRCSMCGALGIGNNLNELPDDDLEIIKTHIVEYKRVRDIVQFGKLYRLKNFMRDDFHAVQYVNGNKSVVFTFLLHSRYLTSKYSLKLKGLDENAMYEVKERNGTIKKSGAFLMKYGIDVNMKGDYDSQMIEIEKLA